MSISGSDIIEYIGNRLIELGVYEDSEDLQDMLDALERVDIVPKEEIEKGR